MKFLNYRGERFILVADLLNWLIQFAEQLEDGNFLDNGEKEGQLVWNIVSALAEQDLTAKGKKDGSTGNQ
jgi:hypothetical protein